MKDLVSWIKENTDIQQLQMLDTSKPGSLCFLGSNKFLPQAIQNRSIGFLVIPGSLLAEVKALRPDIHCYISPDPLFDFYTAHNQLAQQKLVSEQEPSKISSNSEIGMNCSIAKRNVVIEENVKIEDNVVIKEGVVIKENVTIHAGSTLGVEGFEYKRSNGKIIHVVHDGRVLIEKGVSIGANNTLCKGFMGRDTVIGEDTKTDCLVHIAHGVTLGKGCLVAASAMIAGSVNVGNEVWIGPNASISNGISLGDNSRIAIGSVVVNDVPAGDTVAGNFATDHMKFIRWFKKQFRT